MYAYIYIYVYITTPTFSNATEAAGIRAEMSLAFCDPAFLPPGGEVAAGGIIDKTRHLKRVFVKHFGGVMTFGLVIIEMCDLNHGGSRKLKI